MAKIVRLMPNIEELTTCKRAVLVLVVYSNSMGWGTESAQESDAVAKNTVESLD